MISFTTQIYIHVCSLNMISLYVFYIYYKKHFAFYNILKLQNNLAGKE